jgi:hypothetical protein
MIPPLRTEPLDEIIEAAKDAASRGIGERAALLSGAIFYMKRVKEYVSDYRLKSECGYELDRLGELKANLTVALGFAAVDDLVPSMATAAATDWHLITSGIDFKRMERNKAALTLR